MLLAVRSIRHRRLSRDAHFISGLMSHRTPFIVAELGPDVDPLFSIREKERSISTRSTDALAALRAQRKDIP